MLSSPPKPSRIQTQAEYGIPAGDAGLLPWSFVVDRLLAARNYWLVTVRPDARPHASPVWGVWVAGDFFFGMGRETRKARNLAENQNVVIHLDSSDDAIIIEGVVREVTDTDLHVKIDDAYEAKYQIRHGTPVFKLQPKLVMAWDTNYPKTATRWVFE
jgi:hypothetical protein